MFVPKYARKTLRYIEERRNPVSAVLEECINDPASRLSRLNKVNQSSINIYFKVWRGLRGSVEDKIMEELSHYWKGLAEQGRTLEEAAR